MSKLANSVDAASEEAAAPGSPPRSRPESREEYLDRLSAVLGVDRTRMIASAWSGDTVPAWLQETPADEPAARPARRRRNGLAALRQTTMLCVTAALGSCLFLYWGKSQAAMADREIGRILHATQEAHARVYALRAEWALLNQPDRLRDMADHHLALRPIAPEQFAEPARFADRLPLPATGPAVESPDEDTAVAAAEPAPPTVRNASAVVKVASAPEAASAEQEHALAASAEQEPALAASAEREPALAASAGREPVLAAAGQEQAAQAAEPAAPTEAAASDAVQPPARVAAARADQVPATDEDADDAPLRHVRVHAARAVPTPRYLTPMVAEARQPMRVRDSGEALLNGEPEAMHLHAAATRVSATAALSPLARAEASRMARRTIVSRIDLPHWLLQAHLVRPGRSEPPHALGAPLPLAAPQPQPAAVQRVVARPAAEPEHAPVQQAQDQAYDPPPYRPAYRPAYPYGNPYRPYYGQAYGGGYYGNPYGNPYYRSYAPPPPPNGYYQ